MITGQIHNSGMAVGERICVFSQRGLQRLHWRCNNYEFEDVICEVDDAELLTPEPYNLFDLGHRIANRLARHFSLIVNPKLAKIRLKKDYDLFFAFCHNPKDLLTLNAVAGWKERCRTSVCWLEEIWRSELHHWTNHFKILSKFDYIVLGCNGGVGPVQDATGRPCFYLPPGIDTIRFCPYPNPPPRFIDVYSVGRRSELTHHSLLKMAEKRQIFYIYDTINGEETPNHEEHRNLIANLAKRSRYFIANTAKIDRPWLTQTQREFGYRFVEGTASGAVLIGEPPETDVFREHFDWTDAVIHVPFNTEDIAAVLADLDSQPDRLEEIRTNNVVQSLLRHDWVHRWRTILDTIGLEPTPGVSIREKRLKELAEMAKKSHDFPASRDTRPSLDRPEIRGARIKE